MRLRILAAALILLLQPTVVRAWDGFGHMVVAAIAYQKLDPAARQRADTLLRRNPDYASWVSGVANPDKAETAFIRAATWPDVIKHAAGYQNDGEAPRGPAASRNIGYADKLQHRYWHYIDLPFSPDSTPLHPPQKPNAQTQIAAFRAALASHASADIRSYDLVWLLHLVGDVHQPLHATARFTHDLPRGDDGGNKVALCAQPCRGELHAFWDNVLGTSESLATIRSTAARLAAIPFGAGSGSEADWVRESFEEAKRSVYVPPVGVGAGPFALDDAYKTNAKQIAEKRIALAGARLAVLLNDALR